MAAEPTPPKQQIGVPFKPGESGNPAGRPKGSRNKLGEAFLKAMQEDFDAHGASAIVATRETKPEVYVRVIAGLLPSEHNLTVNRAEDLTDDELRARVAELVAKLAPFAGIGPGIDAGAAADAGRKGKPARIH